MSEINKNKIAYIFPGQGSQAIGMGQEICNVEPDAKNAFRIVGEQCEFDLAKVAWIGPEEALNRTLHTQPALYASSAACLQALRRYFPENPLCVAGHSLGELTALWAAGVYDLADGARLCARRASLMNNAKEGAMAAVLGYDQVQLADLCEEYGVSIANYNTPVQQVITGEKDKVAQLVEHLKENKVKAIPLAVSGAFHSELMEEASQDFQKDIEAVEFRNAEMPVIQNCTAKAHQAGPELQNNLVRQMRSSVYWVQSIETMLELGVEAFVEIGSGKVLSGLIKKIDRSLPVMQVSDMPSMKATLEALGATELVN